MRLLELERRKRGMTQADLGELAGVDASYICRAERHGMAYDGHLESWPPLSAGRAPGESHGGGEMT